MIDSTSALEKSPETRSSTSPRPEAIFLHGMWRCGSTYVWSRFRELQETYCYFEPLLEGVSRLTPDRINRQDAAQTERNRHPKLAAPYQAEFAPLIEGRGVSGYSRNFANQRFQLCETATHDDLKCYVEKLIAFAAAQNKTAVLGLNRSILRQSWMKTHFQGVHIYIERGPEDIWASYHERAMQGDYTFLTRWLMIIEQNCEQPLFRMLAKRLGLPDKPPRFVLKQKRRYQKLLRNMNARDTYFMVFTLWLASLLQALSYGDFILDMNRAEEIGYIEDAELRLAALTGMPVDFSTLEPRISSPPDRPENIAAIQDEVIALFPLTQFGHCILAGRARKHINEISRGKGSILARLLF